MLKRLLMIGAVAASIIVGGCVDVGAASADPAVCGGPGRRRVRRRSVPSSSARWSRGGPGRRATGWVCRFRSVHRAASADDVQNARRFHRHQREAGMANTLRGWCTPPAKTTRTKHTRRTTPTSPSWRFTNETIPPRHPRGGDVTEPVRASW